MWRAAIFVSILVFLGCWMIRPVWATTPAEVLDQNVVVAYQPPQASAEALLKLPTVYALPGSFVYWLKHVVEEIQLVFATDPEQRSKLLLDLSQQRLAEGYQAMKEGKWSSAISAFEDYQSKQQQLSGVLSHLQDQKVTIQHLLDRLKKQLSAQQALLQYSQQVHSKQTSHELSMLLEVKSSQTLALARAENGALLGAKTQRQASASATPSATPVVE